MASTSDTGSTKGSQRRGRGFRHTASLLNRQVKTMGQARGFLETRLLTHWREIVGPDTAEVCEPVEVSHKNGFGATLVLLTNGANAPLLEMQKDAIRERVNSVYGYSAITRIRITQTAAHGFGETASPFAPAPKKSVPQRQDPATQQRAAKSVREIENPDLRDALNRLGVNVLAAKPTDEGHSK